MSAPDIDPKPSPTDGSASLDARSATARSDPESQLVADILLALGQRADVFVWRNNTGAYRDARGRLIRYGLPGSADILGVGPGGRALAIEVKSPRGRQSEQQRKFQAAFERRNGHYILARSLADVTDAI